MWPHLTSCCLSLLAGDGSWMDGLSFGSFGVLASGRGEGRNPRWSGGCVGGPLAHACFWGDFFCGQTHFPLASFPRSIMPAQRTSFAGRCNWLFPPLQLPSSASIVSGLFLNPQPSQTEQETSKETGCQHYRYTTPLFMWDRLHMVSMWGVGVLVQRIRVELMKCVASYAEGVRPESSGG